MRIVAGLAKGRRLAPPPDGTRPTSDRAREGLFNSLAALVDLDDSHVLDLFAGTGAVGLEALSRGAETAVFVESGHRAADVLRRNVDVVALPGARIVRRAVTSFLAGRPDTPFELVFADPPYAVGDDAVAALLVTLGSDQWLAPDAVVVIERAARGAGPVWPATITPVADRRYGEGVLWYGRRR
ncbi:MAG: 16S rRNA (guanine(966)-N(2))-methyltransferase RsmD [Jatrophihabitans sp.]